MITNLNNFVNESLGSSLALPANGLGGSRATSLLVAHFALQNTASNSAENSVRRKVLGAKPKQVGKKEGGWGEGIFARLLLFPFRLSKGKAEGGGLGGIPLFLCEIKLRPVPPPA